ncbi:MAG: 6,7-dimethyl-8-ribityllumazine synthase [Gammaproteobacteria bacterium]|nr:6,7-dimethyl-8-ribityllumazine synthase [Gammaproteobacteria bacterium]
MPPKPQRGEFVDARVAILATRWNVDIVDALVDGARRGLRAWGVIDTNIELLRVPGAFELPLAAAVLARRKPCCDGIVALGVVIRGETPHFDFVAGECARGLREVSVRRRLPLGFGVLTVDDPQQARRRAGPRRANKGYEAATAMLEMLRLLRSVSA